MLYPPNKVNCYNLLIKEEIFTWDTQKNTGVEEKWVQKKEELVKETKENKLFLVNEVHSISH